MEYHFTTDFTSKPKAKCSMDHEAFGHWLTEEVSNKKDRITKLNEGIKNIELGVQKTFLLEGSDYALKLTREDAIISATDIGFQGFDDLIYDEDVDFEIDELALDDQQGHAMCGLEDFKELISAWQDFI